MTEEQQPPDNPWRESLEGVISGDNFLRRGEIYSLIEYIDDLLKRIEELSLKLAHYDHKCCEQKVLLKRSMEELADYMSEMTKDHAHVCCHNYGIDHAHNCTAKALHTDIANHLETNNE